MPRSIVFFRLCLALACMPGTGDVRAAEGNDNCNGFIDALPATISTQGVWCLDSHKTTHLASGAAILVNGNNITIDCNGFAVTGTAGTSTGMSGIAAVGRSNITIRNCDVRGFRTGIYLPLSGANGSGHLVEDNQVEHSRLAGVDVQGSGSVVRRNRVLLTGGSPAAATAPIYGIHTRDAVDVIDNLISGMTPGNGGLVGIHALESPSARISGNHLRDLRLNASTGPMWGIYTEASGPVAITGNTVAAASHEGGIGLACDAAHLLDNVVVGFVTGQFGCQDHGGNVYVP